MRRKAIARLRDLRVTLWTLIVPPVAWAAHFLFCYLWAAVGCAPANGPHSAWQLPLAVGLATAIALLVISLSGVIAWVQERTPGDDPPHEQGTDIDRLRFLAKATLLLAGLSFAAVVFTALPVLFLTDCR
jgi:heme/copper-type cytochrome/quinol oxidase subunit 2